MTTPMLVDVRGKPIHSSDFARPTNPKPLLGEISAVWAGRNEPPRFYNPASTSQLWFDTSGLTLDHFRIMREHYQISSSLTVLSFMLHQIEWRVVCDDIKVAKHCEDNLREIWTRLIRAMSRSFWCGFSANALQWENDLSSKKIMLTKVKDLPPDEVEINWKKVKGVSASRVPIGSPEPNLVQVPDPEIPIFDGIKQKGMPIIPKENALWYPLLMEEGDYTGRKLLRAAYQPWFFSLLMHYFSNRYFERFGEPVIITRGSFEDGITVNGTKIPGNVLMNGLASMARSGSSITLPNSRIQEGLENSSDWEYTMEYLESQMRGADFERYLIRLDQEMSMALFTPLLMMNASQGGSFNLGVIHSQMYQNMVAAIGGDLKEYIDRYILAPMAIYNFGRNATLPRWEFKKPGKISEETIRAIIVQLLSGNNGDKAIKLDIQDVADTLGIGIEETEILTEPDPGALGGGQPGGTGPGPDPKKPDTRVGRPEREKRPKGTEKKTQLAMGIAGRLTGQIVRQLREEVPPESFQMDLGHHRQLAPVIGEEVVPEFERQMIDWVTQYYQIQYLNPRPLESEIRSVLEKATPALLLELSNEGPADPS